MLFPRSGLCWNLTLLIVSFRRYSLEVQGVPSLTPLSTPHWRCQVNLVASAAGVIPTAAAATPAAGTGPQGGKNVFPLSEFWSILKTAHTPHMSLQVIGFLQFHNHHTHQKKKKNERKKHDQLLRAKSHNIVIECWPCDIISLNLLSYSVSYFAD